MCLGKIGVGHEFRPLSAAQVRQLPEQHWMPLGVALLAENPRMEETVATSVRVTEGSFRLLHRLLDGR